MMCLLRFERVKVYKGRLVDGEERWLRFERIKIQNICMDGFSIGLLRFENMKGIAS